MLSAYSARSVIETLAPLQGFTVSAYLDKAAHLAAIHKLPSRSRSPCNARTVTSCRWDKFWDMSQDWRKLSPWHSKKVIHCRLMIEMAMGEEVQPSGLNVPKSATVVQPNKKGAVFRPLLFQS
jgi:hypothetical protein